MTTDVHSLWLMPNEADAQRLAVLVADLARRFDTPLFTPHLTLKGDSALPPAALEAATAKAAHEVAAFAQPIAAIETSAAYFRAFYARFTVSPALARLKRALDGDAADVFMPHVSLLYGDLPETVKAPAAAEFAGRLVGWSVRFDRVAVVRSGQDIPIADWSVVASKTLGG